MVALAHFGMRLLVRGNEEVCYESLVAVIDYPRIIVLGVYVCRSAGGRKGMNMTETIIVALITGGLSLLGVIITSNKTTRDVQAKLDKQLLALREVEQRGRKGVEKDNVLESGGGAGRRSEWLVL